MTGSRRSCYNIKTIYANNDRGWPALFQKERAVLSRLLGPGVRIEHIGSTAVPGLAAKPTIDILAEKPRHLNDERLISLLEANGYIHMAEQERHLMFVKGYGPRGLEKESYHIHLGPLDQAWLWDRIHFRDYLIQHPTEAQNYEQLKIKLAAEHGNDREAYTDEKAEYIRTITDKATRGLQGGHI